jgi:hypothetical protein
MWGKIFVAVVPLAALTGCYQAESNTTDPVAPQNAATASNAAVATSGPPPASNAAPAKIRLVNVETAPTGTAFFAYYELPDGRLFTCKWDASLNPLGCFPMTQQGVR